MLVKISQRKAIFGSRSATYLLLSHSQRSPLLPNQPRPLWDGNVLEITAFLAILGEQNIRSDGLLGLALVLNLRVFGPPLMLPGRGLWWVFLVQLTAGAVRLLDLLG